MLKTLKGLLGLAQREDAGTDELAPSLPQAEAELDAARQAQAAAEAAYRASLLDGDDGKSNKLDTARREAAVRVDRGEVLITELRKRLAAAQDREAEAERVARYEAARLQADDAAAALREMYPHFAQGLVDLMRGVAEAEILVRQVNGDLPRGAAPIRSVEHAVRDDPGTPEEILSEETVTIWCRPGNLRHDSVGQEYVQVSRGGRGYVQPPSGQIEQLVPRKFRVETYVPAHGAEAPYSLGTRLALPGLKAGDPAIYDPIDPRFETIGPEAVLKKLDRSAAAATAGPKAPPDAKERHTLIGTYDLEAELRAPVNMIDEMRRRA